MPDRVQFPEKLTEFGEFRSNIEPFVVPRGTYTTVMGVYRENRADIRERELIARIVTGDRQAFEEFFRMYHERLFQFIFRLTRSHTASDELTNDILLLVWNKAGQFRGESKVSTWVFGIAYRQSMRFLTRRKSLPTTSMRPDDISEDPVDRSGNEDWVEKGLATLPPAQRLTTLLVFYVGMTYEEVARITDCPVNTVKTRMFHARRRLKEVMPDIASPTNERASA